MHYIPKNTAKCEARDVRVLEHAPGRLGAERQTLLDSGGCICSMDRTHGTSMTCS